MNKVILALLTALIVTTWGTFHFYGKVSGVETQLSQAQGELKMEQQKTIALREEYNALQLLYDKGQSGKDKSKEVTGDAKKDHRSNGVVTRASEYDARLLTERSRQVRERTTGNTGVSN